MFDIIAQDALVICMFDKIFHVAFILYVTWHKQAMAKHFRCRTDTGGRRSSEAVIVKKADMWP